MNFVYKSFNAGNFYKVMLTKIFMLIYDPTGKTVITSDHALKLEFVPDWVAIVGSGYIGLEFSDVYTALGSEVVSSYLLFFSSCFSISSIHLHNKQSIQLLLFENVVSVSSKGSDKDAFAS